MKIKIKSFNGELPSYLTVGRVYRVSGRGDNVKVIYDDNNSRTFISLDCCRHLNGGSWEVVSE